MRVIETNKNKVELKKIIRETKICLFFSSSVDELFFISFLFGAKLSQVESFDTNIELKKAKDKSTHKMKLLFSLFFSFIFQNLIEN